MDYDGNNGSEHRDDDDGASWGSGFSLWEEQIIRETEMNDVESQMTSEKDASNHRLWLLFQASACSIAQLYRDRTQGVSMWLPFQSAASNVTNMYRECMDSQKKLSELCIQTGVQRRNQDVLKWLKKKKRSTIRRDELISFICGKSIKSNHSNIHVSRSPRRMTDGFQSSVPTCVNSVFSSSLSQNVADHRHSLHSLRSPQNLTFSCLSLSDAGAVDGSNSNSNVSDAATDLQPFRDALALSTLSPPSATVTNWTRRAKSHGGGSPSREDLQELNTFMADEFSRNLDSKKRPFSATDVVMSSPTHKKSKYL